MESAAACTGSRALTAPRIRRAWFPRALHDVFGRCTARYGLKSSNKLQSKSIQAQKPGESVSALRGLSRVHRPSPLGRGNGTGKRRRGLISATVIANPHHRTRARPSERKHSTCIASLIPAIPQIRAMARRWTSCALACVAVSAFAPPSTRIALRHTTRRATPELDAPPDIRWLAKLNPQQPDREPSGANGTMVLPLFPLGRRGLHAWFYASPEHLRAEVPEDVF